MADEFLTKFFLGLADVMSASVLTPREKKLIEIVNRQNAALEAIAAGVLDKSPQQIADMAKGATVVIVERGEEPVSMAQYAAKVAAPAAPEDAVGKLPEEPVAAAAAPPEPEPASFERSKDPERSPVDRPVEERIRAFSATKPLKLVDLPPPPVFEPGPTTVGGGMARAAGRRRDILPALILAVSTLCSVVAGVLVA